MGINHEHRPIEPQIITRFRGWDNVPEGLEVSSIWYEDIFDGRHVTTKETCIFWADGHSFVVGSYVDHDYFVHQVINDPEWLQGLHDYINENLS